jgi:4-amino-4-deoxychorismate lyase
MCRFFETIKCEDGKLQLIDFHNERLMLTQSHFFGTKSSINLQEIITIPCDLKTGIVKVRVEYSKFIENISFEQYQIKNHNKLKLIFSDHISYPYKYIDRQALNEFLIDNEEFDDVIFIKNKELTDTSYTNIALFKNNTWYTPETPLFSGVKRRLLIENQTLIPETIKLEDMSSFQKIAFINAMRDFEKIYTFVVDQENTIHLCQIN